MLFLLGEQESPAGRDWHNAAMTFPALPSEPPPRELTEADLVIQQPGVRAKLLVRLEDLYAWCEDGMAAGERPDPRFAELAVRILDREAKIFRLDRPPQETGDEVDERTDVMNQRAIAMAQLEALGSRESKAS